MDSGGPREACVTWAANTIEPFMFGLAALCQITLTTDLFFSDVYAFFAVRWHKRISSTFVQESYTISALYCALLYMLKTCSPHLHTIGVNKR